MEKAFQVIVFFVLFSALSSAVVTYEQSSNVDLNHPVRYNGALVSNAECNISVYYPNETVLIDFQPMTDNGDYFNYTLNTSQTSLKGVYDYIVTCYNASLSRTRDFNFLINLGGVEPTEGRTNALTRVIFIFFGLGVVFLIAIFFVKSRPIKWTMFLLMFWFFLMGINNTYLAIQHEVVNTRIEGFFEFFLTYATLANWFIFTSLIILWMITLILSSIERKKVRVEEKYIGI